MREVLEWLKTNQTAQVRDLANLVAIPSISNDGDHAKEIDAERRPDLRADAPGRAQQC